MPGWLASEAVSALHHDPSLMDSGETFRAQLQVGRGRHLGDGVLQHAMIDEADEAEALGERHDLGRRDEGAVGAADAHQAFMERGPPRCRFHHGLEGGEDAALVERPDDLVARPHVLAALRVALDNLGGTLPPRRAA